MAGTDRGKQVKIFRQTKFWALLTWSISLFLGATAVLLADFGMPAWFFFFTQVWFWTLGLPTMLAVRGVTAVWGIPEWTTLPLWTFAAAAAIVACAFQSGFLFLLSRGVRRAGDKKR